MQHNISSDEDEYYEPGHPDNDTPANAAFQRDTFPHMNDDWEYAPPNDCIVKKELLKLDCITRTSELIPAYKAVFRAMEKDGLWDDRSRRSFLQSLFNHHLLRKEELRALADLILPVAVKNLDLVTDLVFRYTSWYGNLHSDLQKHPNVAMAFLHSTSVHANCGYGLRASADCFPWELLTFELFLKQYLVIPGVSPPRWMCSVIKNKFASFLVKERDQIQWVAWKFINLVRLIATDRETSTALERVHSLLSPITLALDELAEEDTEYTDKLAELRFWMLYEFSRSCRVKRLISQLIKEEVVHDKYAVPLLGAIVKDRPVHIGDCLQACKDSECMRLVMASLLAPESYTILDYRIGGSNPVADGNGGAHMPAGYYPWDVLSALQYLVGDVGPPPDPTRVRDWFHDWASSATEVDAVKFIGRFRGTNASPQVLPDDSLALFPLAWREKSACAREFIKTDGRAVNAIVSQFVADGNVIVVKERADESVAVSQTQLTNRYFVIEKSAIPAFDVFMKACFDGSIIDMTEDGPVRSYFSKFNDDVFAFAMAAYCDSPEEIKKIIRHHHSKFSLLRGTVLELSPAVVRASIIEDREFLEEFISNNPFEMGWLPTDLQYDDKLLALAIASDPRSAKCVNDTRRLLAKPAVKEMLLSADLMVEWAFTNLPPNERETPRLGCSILADERLSVHTRKEFYEDTLPTVVKHDRKCKMLAARFFGPDILAMQADCMDLGDGLTTKLLQIVHDSRAASGDSSRSSHSAYLRSLYIDLQRTFMPPAIADRLKYTAANPGKTYRPTKADWRPAWNGFDLVTSISAPPNHKTHAHLCHLHDFLDEVSNLVAMILEPRRRDGITYPGDWYCEKFEGVLVEYKIMDTFNETTNTLTPDATPTLVTKSSGKPVQIPDRWKKEMEAAFANGDLPAFWGVLHAGYGQQTKATKLKNGTLTSDTDWNDVVIKVYGTTSVHYGTGDRVAGFFQKPLSACQSFIECVETFHFHNYNVAEEQERAILNLHRESRRKGGAGVVFRDTYTPTKLVTMDAPAYALYAQKIIDFLHQFPLHVLSLYVHEAEMLGCDDREEQDEDGEDAGTYPNVHAVIDKVLAQIAPPRAEGKRRAASSSRPRPSAKKPRITLQGAVSAAASRGATSAQSAPSASLASRYLEEDDDDDASEVSEVSDGEVSEISDSEE